MSAGYWFARTNARADTLRNDNQFSQIADIVELHRMQLGQQISPKRKSELGQYFTPARVAHRLAAEYHDISGHVRLLDPGAGIGALTAAFVDRILANPAGVASCELTAYEVDQALLATLRGCLEACCSALNRRGIRADYTLHSTSFVDTAESVQPSLFGVQSAGYTHAILNPPYKKINTDSAARRALAKAGIETSNLYSAFVWLALLHLSSGGELLAITPRSFCNGAYFRPFRRAILANASIESIHVFESRTDAFLDDEVLQENVILHLRRAAAQAPMVSIYQSQGGYEEATAVRELPFSEVVDPSDPQHYIHIVPDDLGVAIKREMAALPATLQQLGVTVSTGPVVDFRQRHWLRHAVGPGVAPLLYPESLQDGCVPGRRRMRANR